VFRALPIFNAPKAYRKIHSLILLAVTTAAGIGSFPARFKDELGFIHDHLKEAHEQYNRLESCDVHPMGSFLYHLGASAATYLPDDCNVDPLEALKAVQEALGNTSDKESFDAKSTVSLCFSSGSTRTVVNLSSATPLSTLLLARNCTRASSEHRLKAARYLLESGSDPNSEILMNWPAASVQETTTVQYRQTCLHHCARFESSALVKLFLEHKADPYLKDSMDISPLMYAALRNDRDVVAAFRYFNFEPKIYCPTKETSASLESTAFWPWLLVLMQVGSALSGCYIIRQRKEEQSSPSYPDETYQHFVPAPEKTYRHIVPVPEKRSRGTRHVRS
jgi:hypothetical protein